MKESLINHSSQTSSFFPSSSSLCCPFKPLISDNRKSKYGIEDKITGAAFISVFALLLLPYEKIDGNPVPTLIFTNRPCFFHAFVLGLNFAFCGGVITISLRQLYPGVARVCRWICISSMLVAVGIFAGLAAAAPLAAVSQFFPHAHNNTH